MAKCHMANALQTENLTKQPKVATCTLPLSLLERPGPYLSFAGQCSIGHRDLEAKLECQLAGVPACGTWRRIARRRA